MSSSKYNCPACKQPLFWQRQDDAIIIWCGNLKCLNEMVEGASDQTEINAWHNLRAIYEELTHD